MSDGYICRECGARFSEATLHSYNHMPGEQGFTERWFGCPHCGGGYDEAVTCEGCGEVVPRSDAHYNGHACMYLCDDCFDELSDDEREDFD